MHHPGIGIALTIIEGRRVIRQELLLSICCDYHVFCYVLYYVLCIGPNASSLWNRIDVLNTSRFLSGSLMNDGLGILTHDLDLRIF